MPRRTAGQVTTVEHPARAEVEAFAAQPDQVGVARQFVAGHLAGHPCRSDAELLASELVTNAVTHGRAGEGDTITVTLVATGTMVRISVADHGPRPPCVCRLGTTDDALSEDVAEYGRGLMLLDRLALVSGGQWGFRRSDRGTVVWIELHAEDSTAPSADDEQPTRRVAGDIHHVR